MLQVVQLPLLTPAGGGAYVAKAKADFVNGIYTVNGSPVDITDVLSTTPVLGAGGLQLRAGGIVQQLTGDFLTLLLAPMTVIIEFAAKNFVPPDTTGIDPVLLCMNDNTDSVELPFISAGSQANGVNPTVSAANYDNNWSWNSSSIAISAINSTSKVGYTLNGSHEALSANGSAAQADDTVPTPTDPVPTRGLIGFFDPSHTLIARESVDIHSITIYDPIPDVDLPTLTTP